MNVQSEFIKAMVGLGGLDSMASEAVVHEQAGHEVACLRSCKQPSCRPFEHTQPLALLGLQGREKR